MKGSSRYGERDYAFGQLMLTLRTTIGLTQAGLADRLGVSRRAVAEWERGSAYPKAEHLKEFFAQCVQASAFPEGHEAEQIRALWKAAHQKVLLDEDWLQWLLSTQSQPSVAPQKPVWITHHEKQTTAQPVMRSRVDWGDALDVPTFYDRESEASTLAQWVVQERCRVVSVLGLGGIGKSALVMRVMHQVAPHFEVVLWRSLRDAPECEALLEDCLQVLAPQPLVDIPAGLDGHLSLLLNYLREERALLVLDNLETLLEEGVGTGRMREGYEGYARLLRRVAETEHQSCVLLTSREKPRELVPLSDSDFRWVWLARIVLVFGYGTSAALSFYMLQSYITPALSAAQATRTVPLLSIVGLPATLVALVISGRLSDKLGRRKPFVIVASLLMAVSMAVPLLWPTLIALFIQTFLAALAFGIYLPVDQALFIDVLPDKNAAGRELGIANVASNIGLAIAPILAAQVVALTSGYRMVWVVALVLLLVAAVVIVPVKRAR